jgi:hypothetical protein
LAASGRNNDLASRLPHPQYLCNARLFSKLPRNLAPAFTHYLSERPEMSSQRREVTEGQNNERKFSNMKNRNNQLTAVLIVLAFALAPIVQATPRLDGGPTHPPANEAPYPDGGPQAEQMPVIIINSTGDVSRGKTGSFVLDMKPRLMFGAMFVNFTVSGTAIPGVDYVALVSPAYIGQSGYGTILVQTLPDPRGSANRQAYSVVITLKPGAGYAVGAPSSATMWIKP